MKEDGRFPFYHTAKFFALAMWALILYVRRQSFPLWYSPGSRACSRREKRRKERRAERAEGGAPSTNASSSSVHSSDIDDTESSSKKDAQRNGRRYFSGKPRPISEARLAARCPRRRQQLGCLAIRDDTPFPLSISSWYRSNVAVQTPPSRISEDAPYLCLLKLPPPSLGK